MSYLIQLQKNHSNIRGAINWRSTCAFNYSDRQTNRPTTEPGSRECLRDIFNGFDEKRKPIYFGLFYEQVPLLF